MGTREMEQMVCENQGNGTRICSRNVFPLRACVYIYICVCVCVYIYIYIYIGRLETRPRLHFAAAHTVAKCARICGFGE